MRYDKTRKILELARAVASSAEIAAELSVPYTLGVTITTRWILSALCSAVISSGSAI